MTWAAGGWTAWRPVSALRCRWPRPSLIASLLYNVALGVINKAMPQLMVAFVGGARDHMGRAVPAAGDPRPSCCRSGSRPSRRRWPIRWPRHERGPGPLGQTARADPAQAGGGAAQGRDRALGRSEHGGGLRRGADRGGAGGALGGAGYRSADAGAAWAGARDRAAAAGARRGGPGRGADGSAALVHGAGGTGAGRAGAGGAFRDARAAVRARQAGTEAVADRSRRQCTPEIRRAGPCSSSPNRR